MNDIVDDHTPAPVEPAGPTGETLKFSSTIAPGDFLLLSLKNGLLNIITLTLYRFWGKTEVRQRIWKGVRLNNEAFEYTGRGMELFIGFLLALLVLGLPFLVIVFVVQFMGPEYAFMVIIPFYLFFFWLWGFGVFTAFRYMASRTTWRGIRFQLKGSAVEYGFIYIGMVFLSGLTLGWMWPWAERLLASKIWSELRFGDRKLRFRMERAESEGVYGPYAIGWVGSIVGYILFAIVIVAITFGMRHSLPSETDPNAMPPIAFMLTLYGLMLLAAPFALLIWAPYHAAILRSVAAGVGIDRAVFKLKVKAIPLWWLTVTNLLVLLFTVGFLMPWVQARTARFIVERLESTGEAELAEAHQAARGPGSGEGLADAFGFSAI
ncbi:hypothetical protein GCM10009422_16370 [Brevundimonas kwangchunensis]|uniref:DUF898 domain-containing protein n=1 Tax=Brevundimonas kwangchunensis TaxID=322163 RepID=A0ABN1GW15_9CAUL